MSDGLLSIGLDQALLTDNPFAESQPCRVEIEAAQFRRVNRERTFAMKQEGSFRFNTVPTTTFLSPTSDRERQLREGAVKVHRQPSSVSVTFHESKLIQPNIGRRLVGSVEDTYGDDPYATTDLGSNSTSSFANDHVVGNALYIGLAMGVAVVILIAAGCLFWCCRESSKNRALEVESTSRQSSKHGRSHETIMTGSLRNVPRQDLYLRRRDYGDSMRASIVDDPQDVYKKNVRSFSKRFMHANFSSDVELGNGDSDEIYYKGIKCPRRPSGGRNALYNLYDETPLTESACLSKRQLKTEDMILSRHVFAVTEDEKRSLPFAALSSPGVASPPCERPQRKPQAHSPRKFVAASATKHVTNGINGGEVAGRVKANDAHLIQSGDKSDAGTCETGNAYGVSGAPKESLKANDSHAHHFVSGEKPGKTKSKVSPVAKISPSSQEDPNVNSDTLTASESNAMSLDEEVTDEAEKWVATIMAPIPLGPKNHKKKKDSRTKKSKGVSTANRRPSRVDIL